MKAKRTNIGTSVRDLYGKRYLEQYKVGKQYWMFVPEYDELYKMTGKHWHKITITYMRSGVLFYSSELVPSIEHHFDAGSVISETLIVAELDPNDLKKYYDNIDLETMHFDDELTTVVNFDNGTECEIDDPLKATFMNAL